MQEKRPATQRPPRMRAASVSLLLLAVVGGVAISAWSLATDASPPPPATPAARAEPGDGREPLSKAQDPERVRAAVSRGLAYLRGSQSPNGAWAQDVGYKRGDSYIVTAEEEPHVGVTALALMAFLSGGHLPGRGLHASVVEKGTDFVLACVDPNLGFISQHQTRMYSHAFAALFLAEIYGMTHRADVKEKLQLAVDMIVKSQNAAGSWRYQPFSRNADMSITVCQIMALRAARNVGIRVPKATINRAYEYVDKSAYKERRSSRYGGFRYKLENRSRTTFALTAAGIATLNHTGIYDHELVKAGLQYLKGEMPRFNRNYVKHYYFFYGHYYASQVFFLSSSEDDSLWEWYWPRVSTVLLENQQPDGSWRNDTGPGRAFSTAVACIVLQIPNQYLPIFHR